MTNVMSLMATLGLDSSEYEKGLDESSRSAESFGGKLKNGLGNAARVGAQALKTLSKAAVDISKRFVRAVSNVAKFGDNIDKSSQKMGISAKAYQEWDFVLQHAGSSIDAMKAGMKSLTTATASGSEAFQKLGISQEQVASMNKEDLFAATIKGLQGVGDETERASLANELFGRSAMEMGALLNMSADETEAMLKQVHALGGVMSDEAVSASAKYQDSLQNLKTVFSGLKNNLLSDFLPGFTSVMDGITGLFIGDSGAAASIVTGIYSIIDNMNAMAPAIIEKIKTIATMLIPVIKAVIVSLGELLNDILPVISELIGEIAPVIAEALPGLIVSLLPPLITALGELVAAVITNLPAILSALADGVVSALQVVWNALVAQYPILGEIATSMGQFFADAWTAVQNVWNAAKEWFTNLWTNIASNPWLKAMGVTISNFFQQAWTSVQTIWNGIKDFFTALWDLFSGELSPAEALTSVTTAFSSVVTGIKGLFDGWIEFWSGIWTDITENTGLSDIADLISAPFKMAWTLIKAPFKVAWAFFGVVWGLITGSQSLLDVKEGLKKPFIDAWDNIKSTWNTVRGYFATLWSNIVKNKGLSNIIDKIKQPFSDAWDGIKAVWDKVSGYFKLLWAGISTDDFLLNIWNNIKKPFSDAWDGIKAVWDKVRGYFKLLWAGISTDDFLLNIWNNIKKPFKDAWDSIEGVWDSVTEWFSDIWQDITNNTFLSHVQSALSTPFEKGTQVVDTFKSTLETLRNGIGDIVEGIASGFKTAWNSITSAVQTAIDRIRTFIGLNNSASVVRPTRNTGTYASGKDIADKSHYTLNASAMDTGRIIKRLTPFGYDNQTGRVQYGGDAGAEAVVGVNSLHQMIQKSVASAFSAMQGTMTNQQPIKVQLVLDTGTLLGEVDVGLNTLSDWRGGGRA